MSSLKHLVRETGRVAWSWPPAGARRGRRIAEAQQHFDEVGLREALAEIESLRGAPGASAPEVSLAARESGLLHGELAGLMRPSDRQRHWAAAVEEPCDDAIVALRSIGGTARQSGAGFGTTNGSPI